MAAPSFVGASTGATDAGGAWAFTGDIASAVGNLIIVHMLQDGSTGAVTFTGASNIENLAGTDNQWDTWSAQAVGSPTVAVQRLWFGRTINTSAAPTISGTNTTSEDLYCRMYEFSDVFAGSTIASIIENGVGDLNNEVGTSATVSDVDVETVGADRLALNLIGFNDDLTGFDSSFTGETGGDWTSVASYGSSTGTDGAINLNTAAMPSAGTIGGGTFSITSMSWGVMGFALIPQPPVVVFGTEQRVILQAVERGSVW